MCLLEKTQANKTNFEFKTKMKTKQKQLINQYNSHMIVTKLIIKHIKCMHDLHSKPVSHSVTVSITDTNSIN